MATKSELFTAKIYQKRPKIIFETASKLIVVLNKATRCNQRGTEPKDLAEDA